jgi:hypothetical protein
MQTIGKLMKDKYVGASLLKAQKMGALLRGTSMTDDVEKDIYYILKAQYRIMFLRHHVNPHHHNYFNS